MTGNAPSPAKMKTPAVETVMETLPVEILTAVLKQEKMSAAAPRTAGSALTDDAQEKREPISLSAVWIVPPVVMVPAVGMR